MVYPLTAKGDRLGMRRSMTSVSTTHVAPRQRRRTQALRQQRHDRNDGRRSVTLISR